ncbi:MAG: hypothetical protein EOM05_00935 [Clostridia bacterium]|nr:hypothetical protein [Clostridia bacterium]
MNLSKTDIEFVIICLEQKKIIITEILDVTKQIEVQSVQEDVQIDNLIEQRQVKIQRIKKCDELIKEKLKILDVEEKENWDKIVKCDECSLNNDDEKNAFKLAGEIKAIFIRVAKLDKKAKENLQMQYEEAKSNMATLRKNTASPTNMFSL